MGADVGSDDPKKGTVYVNVIPMIDMLIILMVFLLSDFATSVFDDVRSLVAKMPVFDTPQDEPPPDMDPNKIQDLRVRMTKDEGFLITVRTGEGGSQVAVPMGADGRFDFPKLADELLKIKQSYESHEDALMEVERGILFQDIVDAMDSVREKLVITGDGQKMKYPLFPSISLTDTGTSS
ncbi:MAG: hypothetical protein Kow0090_13310 [Myxococcota bacterium]